MTTLNGIQLSEGFYLEAVRPLLEQYFPGLPHAAALLGNGSEVLGYDDATSTDHHWGPRMQLFVRAGGLRYYCSATARDAGRAAAAAVWRLSRPTFRIRTRTTMACSICKKWKTGRSTTGWRC